MGKHAYIEIQDDSANKNLTSVKNKKSGRPSNIQIQSSFMNIIRGTKLQAINAESELELEISFFTSQQNRKSSNRLQEASLKENNEKIFQFIYLKKHQKQSLLQIFQKQKKNWSYKEIQEQEDLPQYFFDEGDDLSYILYRLTFIKQQNKKILNKRIKAEQMYFLALLCLNSRQCLRYFVLDFLLKNSALIVGLIQASMQKVKLKYDESIIKQKQEQQKKSRQVQSVNTIKMNQFHSSSIYEDSSQIMQSQCQNKGKYIQKQKQMKKISKNISQSDQETPLLSQKQKQEKLIFCFINYISWAYFYIYAEIEKQVQIKTALNALNVSN